MPRTQNFDPSIDECLTFKISMLNKRGHLKREHSMYGASYIWSQRGEKIAEVGYSIIYISEDHKQLILDYQWRKEPVNYTVEIVGIPTNLANGRRWYFICPHTGQRCMNLICPSGSRYFFHRSAFPHLMYESQKQSKAYRRLEDSFGWVFKKEKLQKELWQKYRKRHYRGRPTPLAQKINKLCLKQLRKGVVT